MPEPTTIQPATPEDLARDLAADLAARDTPMAEYAMRSTCSEYQCDCHDALPPAVRVAAHWRAEADSYQTLARLADESKGGLTVLIEYHGSELRITAAKFDTEQAVGSIIAETLNCLNAIAANMKLADVTTDRDRLRVVLAAAERAAGTLAAAGIAELPDEVVAGLWELAAAVVEYRRGGGKTEVANVAD